MCPAHYSFFSLLLKSIGRLVQFCIAVPHPYADVRVDCKDGLNASRALLVLERTILKQDRASRTVGYLCCHPYAHGKVECKKSVNEAVALLVL